MLSSKFIDFNGIGQPDERWASFIMVSPEGAKCPDLKDWYDAVAKIECRTALQEKFKKRLNEVKNLLVFAWFNYSFASTAYLLSILLVEAYLKEIGMLRRGQTLGHFVKQHDNAILSEETIQSLLALIRMRNRLAHEAALVLVPAVVVSSIQRTLDLITELANYHGHISSGPDEV